MAADVMKLTNTGHPDSLLGWLFVDQFGHTWIEATDARAIHVTGATKPFMSELAGNHTVVFMPPSVLLDPKSVDVLHCDEVTTY
jgi:hypothetical protein